MGRGSTHIQINFKQIFIDHSCGVWVLWSPDDRYIIACGTEESTELWIWDIEVNKKTQ